MGEQNEEIFFPNFEEKGGKMHSRFLRAVLFHLKRFEGKTEEWFEKLH